MFTELRAGQGKFNAGVAAIRHHLTFTRDMDGVGGRYNI